MNNQTPGVKIEKSTDILDRKWIDINIPCRAACPIMTDVPGYIKAISEGDYETAYMINRQDNVLPSILGRICSRPCEAACRHGWDGLGDPLAICFLKRSAADFGLREFAPVIKPNHKKVCIIGAGPAGLTSANDLALKGYDVTILEQFEEAGGMLRFGIPRFRLPRDIVENDIKSILDLGVKIKTNTRIESAAFIKELQKQNDAVILAGGCMLPKKLDIPGLDSKGVTWGLDFMMDANRDRLLSPMQKVVVVGGGFTSVDCTRMAHRLGAKDITLTFLFTRDDMTVGEHELDDMEAEGIEFVFLVSPAGIESENGRVTGVKFVRNFIQKDKSIKTIPGSEFVIEADTVVFAIGQEEEKFLPGEKLTAKDNFFITGDFRTGASTVIQAAADGRKIARQVHQKLSNIKEYQDVITITPVKETGRVRDYDFIPLQPMDKIPLTERSQKEKEVDTGFPREKSVSEAKRCYLCHFNFQIDIDRCIYCLACIDVMPVDCIKMAKDIHITDDGNMYPVPAENWEQVQAIVIDNNKCIRCGNCVRACPVDCISISQYTLDIIEKI
ncbi:FAD-dependent oxidoreductase [candidate division KSB1 bacterium]|nr:FAD-dependent oxidoreductase [candidate division KSB1 bacterium]